MLSKKREREREREREYHVAVDGEKARALSVWRGDPKP